MTREELNYIKDAFSQIIDDIAGNPDWYEAARAVASDLGTLERKLEEKISPPPSNLDEAAEENSKNYYCSSLETCNETGICDGCENVKLAFKAGAEWMAGQGETVEGEIMCAVAHPHENKVVARVYGDYKFGDKVVVQIIKK